MIENDLYFNIGNKLTINYKQYIVRGAIRFSDSVSNSTWTEYKLLDCDSRETKWLSIDLDYKEYALYDQYRYSKEFEEQNIIAAGYHEVDSGAAKVSQAMGDVDVEYGDVVTYKEYEDDSEDNIIAVEHWVDETEYSKGRYLEAHEITKEYSAGSGYYNDATNFYLDDRKKIIGVVALVLVMLTIAITVYTVSKNNSKTMISRFLASNGNFTYSTSVTSDMDNKQKADVYSTPLPLEDAAKAIIDGIEGKVVEVQENKEDASVAILTNYEYCFVYNSEDSGTLVQVSSRRYAYTSSNNLYRGRSSSYRYYRNYYYSTAYFNDMASFGSSTNAYTNYAGESVYSDPSDRYKSYSDTVRQSSINSRTSSGGGTSLGK